MAHYAKVLNGKVIDIIVADKEFFDTFVDSSAGKWIQTSYNTRGNIHYDPVTNQPDGGEPLRYNYAVVNGNYDSEADAFYSNQPYPSWILNTDTYIWEAPVPIPDSTKAYRWDEDTTSWIEL